MMSEFVEIDGINFHVKNVLKMKKMDFMNAFKSEDLWEKIQQLKPKPKTKAKAKKKKES